jgi:glycerol kinase
LGAAIAAGLATKVWDDLEEMQKEFGTVHKEDIFIGKLSGEEREEKWELWEWGVERSLGWIKEGLENKFSESTDGTAESN